MRKSYPKRYCPGKPLSANFSSFSKNSFLSGLIDQQFHLFPLHLLRFLEDGTPVCSCEFESGCQGPGKHPRGPWSKPLNPSDPQAKIAVANHVDRWLDRGWGIHLGLSNAICLDIDPKNGGDGSFQPLCERLGIDLGDPHTVTGSGGRHFYFLAPPGTDQRRGFVGPNGQSRCSLLLDHGLEMFAGQHYMVAPFSPHRLGTWYTVGKPIALELPPAALLEHIFSLEVFQEIQSAARTFIPSAGSSHPDAGGSSLAAARAYLEHIPGAIDGQEGSRATSRVASLLLISFALSYDDAFQLLQEWNQKCQPPWSASELARKLDWANGQPGPRGTKGRPLKGSDEDPEIAALKNRVEPARIKYANYTLFLGALWSCWIEADPPSPAIAPDELVDDKQAEPQKTEEEMAEESKHTGKKWCPHCIKILVRDLTLSIIGILLLPCRKLRCEVCGPIRRQHVKDTIRVRLTQWERDLNGEEEGILWKCEIHRDNWEKVAKSIRDKKGEAFRLLLDGSGDAEGSRILVVSSRRPSEPSAVPVSRGQAIEILCGVVDSIPSRTKGRWFWSSWAWKLLPDQERNEKRWQRVGKLKCGLPRALEILDLYSGNSQNVPIKGRYFPGKGYLYTVRARDMENVIFDLSVGEYTGGQFFNYLTGEWLTLPPAPDSSDPHQKE